MADGSEFVEEVLADLGISGEPEGDEDSLVINGLVEVGMLDEVGAMRIKRIVNRGQRMQVLAALMKKVQRGVGAGLPSPPFARSSRETERRAPMGFTEDGTGAFFFSLAAAIGATTTMRGKVSRAARADRLLVVPSAPGVVFQSIMVGDDEQLLNPGAPVELYSTDALTDSKPDNFSPLSPALDFSVTLFNTTVGAITGTIGMKADCKR